MLGFSPNRQQRSQATWPAEPQTKLIFPCWQLDSSIDEKHHGERMVKVSRSVSTREVGSDSWVN